MTLVKLQRLTNWAFPFSIRENWVLQDLNGVQVFFTIKDKKTVEDENDENALYTDEHTVNTTSTEYVFEMDPADTDLPNGRYYYGFRWVLPSGKTYTVDVPFDVEKTVTNRS